MRIVPWIALGLLLLDAPNAHAQEMHRSPHIEETKQLVGLKGAFVSAFNDGKSAVGGGFTLFYERSLIEGWLEIELASAVVFIEGERVVGFDLFFKKPFHVNHVVNPYVGVGPNVTIIIGREEGLEGEGEVRETRTRAGIVSTAGSYFWLRGGRFGFDVALVYLLLFNDGLSHEFTVEAGPAFRF